MKRPTLLVIVWALAFGSSAGLAVAKCGDDPGDAQAVADARAGVRASCDCNVPTHGEYVSCAAAIADAHAMAGLLPMNCKGNVKKCAARSTCGKPGFVTCCRTTASGRTKCGTKSNSDKCTAPSGGTACVGQFTSCCDACSGTGCAARFDAVTDFTITANPNGAWSYGYIPRGSAGPFTAFAIATLSTGGIVGWDQWGDNGDFYAPSVVHNSSGATILFSGVTLPTTLLSVHPTLGDNGVVRWTVPTAGNYQVNGHFEGIASFVVGSDTFGTTTRAFIVAAGMTTFDEQVTGFGIQHPFSFTAMLNAGDTVDFEVDRDTNPCGGSGYCNGDEQAQDSTGFTATITRQ